MLRRAILVLAAGHALGYPSLRDQEPLVPTSRGYIVEFAQGLSNLQDPFNALGGVKVVKQFESPIFKGATIEADDHNAEDLIALPEVVRVWPNQYYQLAAPQLRQTSDLDPTDYDVHNATGVRHLHEKGIRGKGAKVAIVDTGADYHHPALGSGFGEGFKVAGGYDLVGDGYWPQVGQEPEPDDDPIDLSGHGTHVAGIVAGETDNWSGVAPDASLYIYKTFSKSYLGTSDAINIEAFLQAYEDGVDVISASIGGANGWSTGAWAEVSSRLVDQGVIVVIAAGNFGNMGPLYPSSGSSGKNVLAASNIIVSQTQDSIAPNSGTAWGPLYDLQIKPDVGAPGTDIYSTWLDNEFAVLTGTSMATPYTAGIAALFISANGGREVYGKGFAKYFNRRIISNSIPVLATPHGGAPASVAQVGAGLVNAVKTIQLTTDLEFETLALNDTRFFSGLHKLTVINNGSTDVDYKFSKQNSRGVKALKKQPDGTRIIPLLTDLETADYSVEISLPSDFTLKPGGKKTVTINFTNPNTLDWDATDLPIYSGRVIIEGSNGDKLGVPFLGLGADLKREIEPFWLQQPYLISLDPPVNFKNKTSFTFNLTAQDFPKIFSTAKYGTKEIRWDIFEKDWTERDWSWPLVAGENGYVGSGTWWVGSGQVPGWFDDQGWNPDETNDYPIYDISRIPSTGAKESWWFGKLSNGTQIANGDYVLRFAVLKPFGQREASEDWSIFGGPFTVRGQYKPVDG